MSKVSAWFKEVRLDSGPFAGCTDNTRCPRATRNGDCEDCFTIDGRQMERVNEYASTCDGGCMELTMHKSMVMDPYTQLGYCQECIPKQTKEVRERLEAVLNGTWEEPLY